jgi:hypothetical protein
VCELAHIGFEKSGTVGLIGQTIPVGSEGLLPVRPRDLKLSPARPDSVRDHCSPSHHGGRDTNNYLLVADYASGSIERINPGGPISGLTPGQLVALDGTYEVENDGTGEYTGPAAPPSPSATSNSGAPPSVLGSGALVIRSSNNEVQLVSSQTNRVLYTTLKKQHPPSDGFSNKTLRGEWGFTCHGALVTPDRKSLCSGGSICSRRYRTDDQ